MSQRVVSMTRVSAVVLMLVASVVLSCDRTPDASEVVEPPQPTVVVPTLGPSHPPTPALPDLRVVATTTEPLFTSAADLDYAPDGSADPRGKIVAHSTLIVIGTVTDTDPRVERVPGRLTGDPSRPDPNWTTVGYVHDVLVERYLKGRGPGKVPVLVPWGHEETVPGTGNAPVTLTLVSYSARHLYLEKGGRYLLFLTESDHAPGLWTGTAEPYRYLLSEGRGRVRDPRPKSSAPVLHTQIRAGPRRSSQGCYRQSERGGRLRHTAPRQVETGVAGRKPSAGEQVAHPHCERQRVRGLRWLQLIRWRP